jgi:hypothetical protein
MLKKPDKKLPMNLKTTLRLKMLPSMHGSMNS